MAQAYWLAPFFCPEAERRDNEASIWIWGGGTG